MDKFYKLFFSIFLLIISHNYALAQKTISKIEISILTSSPGQEIYSTFGHSSIRVKDIENDIDVVYDYGTFDSRTNGFLLKFINGTLDYQLSKKTFFDFVYSYKKQNRSVYENKITTLSDSITRKIYFQLENDFLPENRNYKYDFFKNNCSTKIRDLLFNDYNLNYENRSDNRKITCRNLLKNYLEDDKWLDFGIDIVLGSSLDNELNLKEEIFLPEVLQSALVKANLSFFQHKITSTIPVSKKDKSRFFFSPLLVLSILVIFIFLLFRKKKKLLLNILFLIYGVLGLFILYLWFFTSHSGVGSNYNILWLNPLYLLFPFLKRTIKKYSYITFLIVNITLLILWRIIPQYLNNAIIPLILLIILLLISILKTNPKKEKNKGLKSL